MLGPRWRGGSPPRSLWRVRLFLNRETLDVTQIPGVNGIWMLVEYGPLLRIFWYHLASTNGNGQRTLPHVTTCHRTSKTWPTMASHS